MNPKQLAAEYSDWLERLKQHRGMLEEFNLSRFEDGYTDLINRLNNLIDELYTFR